MADPRALAAVARIERALARIEAAAARASAPAPDDTGLAEAHAALRGRVESAIGEIDRLLGRGGR